jgi:hypothetical protein
MGKFKEGDKVMLSKGSSYYYPRATKNSTNPINIPGIIIKSNNTINTLNIRVRWSNKQENVYKESDLIIIKSNNMTTKKQTKAKKLELEDGQYFTAIYQKKKVRGYVHEVSGFGSTGFYLCGKGFSNQGCDDDANGFPSYEEVVLYSEETAEINLKAAGFTNFIICTDKRQIAIIEKDKMPLFQDWRVNDDGTYLTFGCGAVSIEKKNAKIFAEILADCNDMNLVREYRLGETDNDCDAKQYYEMRKWLEDNWTPAQKAAFDDTCDRIESEDGNYLDNLDPKKVKTFMAQF